MLFFFRSKYTFIVSFNMLRDVTLFAIAFTVCISRTRSHIAVSSFESFCEASPPTEIDSSGSGKGELVLKAVESKKSWLIKVNNEDDGINIVVSSFDLETTFLVVREASEKISNSGMTQLITGHTEGNLTFFIPYTKSFYMEICPEDKTGKGDFNVTYEREVPDFGEGPLPSDPPEVEKEKQSVEIQFKGRSPDQFRQSVFISSFKEAVKSIASDYCSEAKIPFEEKKLAEEMVTIHNIHRCPAEWSDTEICASVGHSVFASGGDEYIEKRIWEYQLTRENLKKMWNSANVNKYLKHIGVTIYEPPDASVSIGWWFLTIVLPFVLLAWFLLLMRILYKNIIEDKQNDNSVAAKTNDVERRRQSKLKPNKYQQMPSFFAEEKELAGSGVKEGGKVQTEQRSYMAALLFPRVRIMEDIPE